MSDLLQFLGKPKLSRRIPPGFQAAARKYARQIGEIALAWNHLQDALFTVFFALTTDGSIEDRHRKHWLSHGIWHSFQSDKAQREMLLELAKKHPGVSPAFFERLKWAVDRTAELGAYRNAVVHTPVKYVSWQGEIIANPATSSARTGAVERLKVQPVSGNWRRARGDILVVADYCNALRLLLLQGAKRPAWPNKPALLTLPRKGGTPRKKSRRRNRPKRPRLPSASHR